MILNGTLSDAEPRHWRAGAHQRGDCSKDTEVKLKDVLLHSIVRNGSVERVS